MTTNQMTFKQGQALARFIATLRTDWDTPGIEDALAKARALAPCGDLAIAAIKAAGNPAARTPAVIGLEGPHWRGSEVTPQRRYDPRQVCHICGHRETEHHEGTHEFLSVEAARAVPSAKVPAEVRAAIADAPRTWPTPQPAEETE